MLNPESKPSLPRLLRRRPSRSGLAAALLALACAAWPLGAPAQPADAAARTSVAAGVTVNVTPGPFTASEWAFKVVFDTHTQELDDDLRKTAVLVVDGVELHPASWSAPGGGHHREGVLSFSAPTRRLTTIELRITRRNEPAPRVFRWEAAALP